MGAFREDVPLTGYRFVSQRFCQATLTVLKFGPARVNVPALYTILIDCWPHAGRDRVSPARELFMRSPGHRPSMCAPPPAYQAALTASQRRGPNV